MIFIFIFNFFAKRKSTYKSHSKTVFILSLTLILILILIGIFLGYKFFAKPIKEPKQWNLTDNTNNSVKFISEQSLINEIKNVTKIVPLEIEFSESIIIDKSWGDFSVFQKFKKVKFFANCSYAVDLSTISSENIKIDNVNGIVNLTLPKPKVFSIDIDQDKTVYEEVNNGIFRFGDVILTVEEHDVIQREVCKSFENKMKEPEIYEKAVANTTVALENFINDFTGMNLSIKVTFN